MLTILTSQKIHEEIENFQDRLLLYLDGTIGILEDSIQIQESNLIWQPISNNTIIIQKKGEKI